MLNNDSFLASKNINYLQNQTKDPWQVSRPGQESPRILQSDDSEQTIASFGRMDVYVTTLFSIFKSLFLL